jgi:Zn-dependent M28 family amino/carboxypeptidase
MVPNLKTATIFGTLPGMTDETVYISAHRDAIFDGATDNASGLAAMMGLAEYFSKIPKERRRRTLIFVSPTGHHNDCEPDNKVPCSISIDWMAQHHDELFSRTALMINLEHLTTAQTYMFMGPVRISDAPQEALFWWVRGSDKVRDLAYNTYREFGVPIYVEHDKTSIGDMDPLFKYSPAALNLIDLGLYSHTDGETLALLPWPGLQDVTRAFAKIITLSNQMDVQSLRGPEREPQPSAE